MSSMNDFIQREEQTLSNILYGLPLRQRIKYSNKIKYIEYLLTLLETSSSKISPKEKKEIKEKIKKETKDLKKKAKEEQTESLQNFNLTKVVTPTMEELDEATLMKARMVQASKIANVNDFDTAQDYLDNNNIPYNIDRDLSDTETLVLHNPADNDVKLSARGTQLTNARDLLADAMAIGGNESANPEFVKAEEVGKSAINKYGKENVSEMLGFSLGGAKAIYVSDALGIPKSTTFNPLITMNAVNKGKTSTKHEINRTTEDLPSTMVGFKGLLSNADNWDVKSILPKKISLDVREAHKHSNFLDNEGRATHSQLNDHLEKVSTTGKRKGESELVRDMASYLEGNGKGIIRATSNEEAPTADPLVRTKQASHSGTDPFLDHQVMPKSTWESGITLLPSSRASGLGFREEMLKPLPASYSREAEDVMGALMEGNDPMDYASGKAMRELVPENVIGYDKRYNKEKIRNTNKKVKNKNPDQIKSKKDYSKEIEEINQNLNDINEELPQHELLQKHFTLEDVKGTSAEARFRASVIKKNNLEGEKEELNNRLKEINEIQGKESQEWKSRIGDTGENRSHKDILNELLPKPKKIMMPEPDPLLQRPDPLVPPDERSSTPLDFVMGEPFTGSIGKPINYTDFLHKFQSRQGSDTEIINGQPKLKSNRFNRGSKFHKLWEEMGGQFSQEEINHFDTLPDTEVSDFGLNEKERHFMIEDSPNGREEQIKQYTQEHTDAINDADNYTSIPDGETVGVKRSVTNDFIRAASPTNFLLGYYASKLTDKALNFADPVVHLNNTEREAVGGATSGFLTELGIAGLAGSAGSALSFEIAAPVLTAGAVGGIVGGETYKALDKKGVSEPVNSAISGAAAGGAAAATGMLVAAGTAAATGGAIGTAFDPFTFGMGTVIGIGVGGMAGEASYLMGKAGL